LNRWLVVAAGVVVLALVAGLSFAWQLDRFMHTPMPGAATEFEIKPGTSLHAVSRDLATDGRITRPALFRLYARLKGLDAGIHAGEYLIEAGTTPHELLQQLTAGDVRLYSFTLVEGWNQWDLRRAMDAHPEIESTLTDEDWPAFLADIGAGTDHPEGLFLPETYRFPRGTSDRQLLEQSHEQLRDVLDAEWQARAEDLPFDSPYEALILASIVEKETALADERAQIAGVFVRRLEKGMRLQTDPTVIYGIGPGFNGNLTRTDLRTYTPYNTYRRGGLPPTPIAMPGRAAIHAALNPAAGDTLYFVATGLGDGSHKFSVTKEEHDAAVAEYLTRLRSGRSGDGQ